MLFVKRAASTPDLLNTMPVEKSLVNGVFSLNVLQPSFDFQHCQHADVELIIPERLAKQQRLALKAQTIVGKITVDAPEHTFTHVSLFANVGYIKAEHVKAENTFEAEARVGYVNAHHVEAKGAALRTTFGYVNAADVKADEAEVFVETGRASLGFFAVPTFTLNSELGLVSAWSFSKVRTVNARVDYGRLNWAAEPGWHGKFVADSPYGFLDVSHCNSLKPTYEQQTPAIISGSFPALTTDAKADESSVALRASYAAVNFFVPGGGPQKH